MLSSIKESLMQGSLHDALESASILIFAFSPPNHAVVSHQAFHYIVEYGHCLSYQVFASLRLILSICDPLLNQR